MGLFDYVRFSMTCPNCGQGVDDFQSKDGDCMMREVEYWEVDRFYAICGNCKTWIEFNRKKEKIQPIPLSDYEMEYHYI